MYDNILGHLREARASICESQESGDGSRELSLVMTKCEEAILWRERDLYLKQPMENGKAPGKEEENV